MNSRRKNAALVSVLLTWFAVNARDLPWRRTKDPYAIHVSEIMLQQTQVKTVIPYWDRWMRELPTIQSLAKASPAKIHKLWEGLGYYTRVRNMQKAAQVILEKHDGRFPKRFEEVLDLPGIGRYTAGAICSIAFGQPTPILDGNVIRVLTRLFGISENPRDKETNARLWLLAESLVQASVPECSHLNQSLMELGALICTPRQPKCDSCPVRKTCVALKEGRIEELPNLGERTVATSRRFVAFVCERDGHLLVRQRPEGVVNAHLWEFPNVETQASGAALKEIAARELGAAPRTLSPVHVVKHSITRYRITLEAYRVEARVTDRAGVWLPAGEIQALAFTSAHKKILDRLSL